MVVACVVSHWERERVGGDEDKGRGGGGCDWPRRRKMVTHVFG